MERIIFWLDLCGVAVFAASGALSASRKQMDVIGFILIGSVTGIGGGTVRDLLLSRPVAWVAEPSHLLVCTAVAGLVFVTAHHVESRFRVLVWADAVGLALFCVLGAETALAAGAPAMVAALMGVTTATFGGLIRDMLCGEIPLILRKEIYATAAAVGAVVHVALHYLQAGRVAAVGLAFTAAFATRAIALALGLSLPAYRSRPGRPYPMAGEAPPSPRPLT